MFSGVPGYHKIFPITCTVVIGSSVDNRTFSVFHSIMKRQFCFRLLVAFQLSGWWSNKSLFLVGALAEDGLAACDESTEHRVGVDFLVDETNEPFFEPFEWQLSEEGENSDTVLLSGEFSTWSDLWNSTGGGATNAAGVCISKSACAVVFQLLTTSDSYMTNSTSQYFLVTIDGELIPEADFNAYNEDANTTVVETTIDGMNCGLEGAATLPPSDKGDHIDEGDDDPENDNGGMSLWAWIGIFAAVSLFIFFALCLRPRSFERGIGWAYRGHHKNQKAWKEHTASEQKPRGGPEPAEKESEFHMGTGNDDPGT
jgi:hypothetical protein